MKLVPLFRNPRPSTGLVPQVRSIRWFGGSPKMAMLKHERTRRAEGKSWTIRSLLQDARHSKIGCLIPSAHREWGSTRSGRDYSILISFRPASALILSLQLPNTTEAQLTRPFLAVETMR